MICYNEHKTGQTFLLSDVISYGTFKIEPKWLLSLAFLINCYFLACLTLIRALLAPVLYVICTCSVPIPRVTPYHPRTKAVSPPYHPRAIPVPPPYHIRLVSVD